MKTVEGMVVEVVYSAGRRQSYHQGCAGRADHGTLSYNIVAVWNIIIIVTSGI